MLGLPSAYRSTLGSGWLAVPVWRRVACRSAGRVLRGRGQRQVKVTYRSAARRVVQRER